MCFFLLNYAVCFFCTMAWEFSYYDKWQMQATYFHVHTSDK